MERSAFERLRWRCIRRGLLELDITLTRFLEEDFASLTPAQLDAFVGLADMEDHQLWSWINDSSLCETKTQEEVLILLRKSQVRQFL